MRIYRETMPKSDCVHCCKSWLPDSRSENKGRFIWECELEEYDPLIGCQKGQCHYYRQEKKAAEKERARQGGGQ